MRKIIAETTKETIRSMVRAGQYGWQIQEATGVSLATINKIRKEVREAGWDHVYHKKGGVVSNWNWA